MTNLWSSGGDATTNIHMWSFEPWAHTGSITDNSEMWFSDEFLYRPLGGFEIDWSASPLVCAERVIPELIGKGKIIGKAAIAGVLIKLPSLQRVWRLTGEYDFERNGYHGRWPD